LAIPLLCYFRAAPTSSEVTQRLYGAVGVVYLVVFSLAVITTVTHSGCVTPSSLTAFVGLG
jgi:hypothetical protein